MTFFGGFNNICRPIQYFVHPSKNKNRYIIMMVVCCDCRDSFLITLIQSEGENSVTRPRLTVPQCNSQLVSHSPDIKNWAGALLRLAPLGGAPVNLITFSPARWRQRARPLNPPIIARPAIQNKTRHCPIVCDINLGNKWFILTRHHRYYFNRKKNIVVLSLLSLNS